MLQLYLVGNLFAGFWQQLHKAHGVSPRNREWVELRFLPDQRRHEIRIQSVGH